MSVPSSREDPFCLRQGSQYREPASGFGLFVTCFVDLLQPSIGFAAVKTRTSSRLRRRARAGRGSIKRGRGQKRTLPGRAYGREPSIYWTYAPPQISCQGCVLVLCLFPEIAGPIVVFLRRGVSGRRERGAIGPGGNKGVRRQMASQRREKIESGPGNDMGAAASNPQDMVQGRVADRAPLRLTNRENDKAVLSLEAREAVGKRVARKSRRNALKRLNPGAEIVWPRKPATYKIWYTGARLTVRGSG